MSKHYYENCQVDGLAYNQTSAVDQIVDMVRDVWTDNGWSEDVCQNDDCRRDIRFVKRNDDDNDMFGYATHVDITAIYGTVLQLHELTGATTVTLGAGEGEYKISLNTL